jgi:hypothetical protein
MRIFAAILLVSFVKISPVVAEESPRPLELVPSVRRGHSAAWQTGAIITFTSIGVSLFGAALTVGGLQGANFETGRGGNAGLFIAGITISAIGDAGMFIGGPITWMSGIRGRDQ